VEELTPEPEAESSPDSVIKPVPLESEKQKANGFFNRLRPPASEEATPDPGLPPTLPEIIETPFSQPSEPKAAFPVPQPSLDSELKPSSTTPAEASPVPNSVTEKEPTASSSQMLETPNPEPAAATPKLNLKETFLPLPAPTPSPRIIQAPANPELDIPSRFKKSAPDAPPEVLEPSEEPTAGS
jgi:hypothetical protein